MPRSRVFMPGVSVPPLEYAGEREALCAEHRSLKADLRNLPPRSHLRPGLEYRLRRVTTRLMQIGAPSTPVPGLNRKDMQ